MCGLCGKCFQTISTLNDGNLYIKFLFNFRRKMYVCTDICQIIQFYFSHWIIRPLNLHIVWVWIYASEWSDARKNSVRVFIRSFLSSAALINDNFYCLSVLIKINTKFKHLAQLHKKNTHKNDSTNEKNCMEKQ